LTLIDLIVFHSSPIFASATEKSFDFCFSQKNRSRALMHKTFDIANHAIHSRWLYHKGSSINNSPQNTGL